MLIIQNLFKLLFAHALGDFALQSDTCAKGKNRHNKPKLSSIPPGQEYVPCWPYFLCGHAFTNGAIFWLLTGNIWIGIAETFLHAIIDFMKCENITNPNSDQLLHFLCMIGYLFFM